MDANLLEAVWKDANCFKKFELEIRIKENTQGQNVGHNFVAERWLLIYACNIRLVLFVVIILVESKRDA